MKQATRIPVWRTFLNWIIAVVAGSILWPIIMSLFRNGPKELDAVGGFMLISAVVSALTSLPAMLILLFANWQMNKQEMPRSRYRGIHILIHMGVAILTFCVIYYFAEPSKREFFPFLVLAATYTVVGITTWAITFRIYRNKQVNRTDLREDILDEI
jgi:hypothetical protein